MGIAKSAAKLLLKESKSRPFTGSVLTLGKQDVHFSFRTLQEIADEFEVKLSNPGPIALSLKPEFAESEYISDECLLKSLGFTDYAALDYSAYESAQWVFDLNNTNLPDPLVGAFDVIIDAGTIEHVFHLPNVFNNIFKMLKVGGRIIHFSPSSNHIDHGFYMFSPTLFWDFYETNKFQIKTFQIIRSTNRPHVDPWEISDYSPGCLGDLSCGGLDEGVYGILCIAAKTADSTGDIVPQQGLCLSTWEAAQVTAAPKVEAISVHQESAPAPRYSSYEAMKDRLRKVPFLFKTLRLPIVLYRSVAASLRPVRQEPEPEEKRRGLKVVARY